MGFRVVPAVAPDPTTPPAFLVLPSITRLTGGTRRPLALIEKAAVGFDEAGEAVEGRVEALLGEVDAAGMLLERKWMDPVSENPAVGATEIWEFYNTTADAHPIHVHEVTFQVVNREAWS